MSESSTDTRFTYPGRMEGWVDLQTSRQCNGWESNSRPYDRKSDALTTTPPSHPLPSCRTHKDYTILPLVVQFCLFNQHQPILFLKLLQVNLVLDHVSESNLDWLTLIPEGLSKMAAQCCWCRIFYISDVLADVQTTVSMWTEARILTLAQSVRLADVNAATAFTSFSPLPNKHTACQHSSSY